jgi:ABC-type nickel/cobalt efflux system permease component RcnA
LARKFDDTKIDEDRLSKMIGFLSIIALGFFLGMRHATDPDHVIAVTTVVSRQNNVARSALVGAIWGLGHTLTIFVVGSAIILFDLVIPPRVGLSMELCVAVMLVVLGLINIRSFVRAMPARAAGQRTSGLVHSHVHSHGDYVHTHPHAHEPEAHPHSADHTPVAWLDRMLGGIGVYQHLRPLIIGVVHGLAGSAAVALLVLATIRDSRWAVAYLLVFGVGTIAGMVVITISIASTFRLFGKSQQFFRRLALASGLLSLGFGLLVAYQICVSSGLLSSAPHWTPQ